eukprot:CAMPEP_0194127244 /NCGR_PEP_ID=MMETSP0150-20130528/60422_1 /TAXON_ID=122233 /ORGANISM="Chaetoceros debilis, Strain MM31A-1" /LENGTH=430 /DNA_ID=CAMNT_0038821161 /DNA_START=14 /DNA_END=1306 /DNA_ORIENTATION=-
MNMSTNTNKNARVTAVTAMPTTSRKNFLVLLCMSTLTFCTGFTSIPKSAFGRNVGSLDSASASASALSSVARSVAYQELKVSLPDYGVDVPVAAWFSIDTTKDNDVSVSAPAAVYQHRISIQKIGSMLANLNFIPSFASRDFKLPPRLTVGNSGVQVIDANVNGNNNNNNNNNNKVAIPSDKPVVILAHGFLGSRFDLSHLAEELASQGFVCLSPEYPESLANSYITNKDKDMQMGMGPLDRSIINQQLLKDITDATKINIHPSSYGIVGHSLGCGTVLNTGDDSWTRVTIAGPMARRDGIPVKGSILGIVSLNDGLITRERLSGMIPPDFTSLDEKELKGIQISGEKTIKIPSRSVLVFDRPDAPNHISFLSASANDSMVEFLSPLLPVAQALKIPVLDFDKYQTSRDSEATAEVVIPLVAQFLKQNMM